jgi:tetratricopeptide (TPR) repeat protein
VHDSSAANVRLESWKEIASYLNRSERTVRRWEDNEGLPVHRLHHDKRGSVYAYAAELDAWRISRAHVAEPPESAKAAAPAIARRAAWPWIAGTTAATIAAILVAIVLVQPSAPRAIGTSNPDALRAFKLAEFAINPGRVQIESGLKYYREALRLDPGFAAAWSGLGAAHMAQTWFSDLAATETMANAKRASERARELDRSSGAPLRVLANINHFHHWNHDLAEKQLREALDLEPGSTVTFSWLAEFLADMRRFDEALAYARRAQDAAPRWLEPMTVAGNIHLFNGHPELAIAEYQRALAIEPNFGLANHFLGRAYLASGNHARAIAQLRRSDELMGRVPFTRGDLGYALAVSGAHEEAERILTELMKARGAGFYPAFPIAAIHLGLGRTDMAIEWLDRAADERQAGYYFPSVDPIYQPLRSHPRFIALMRRMNLSSVDSR